jgi:hypothetical protein
VETLKATVKCYDSSSKDHDRERVCCPLHSETGTAMQQMRTAGNLTSLCTMCTVDARCCHSETPTRYIVHDSERACEQAEGHITIRYQEWTVPSTFCAWVLSNRLTKCRAVLSINGKLMLLVCDTEKKVRLLCSVDEL